MSSFVYRGTINSVKFSLKSDEERIRESVVAVTEHETHKDGKPYPNGPNDSHLGTYSHEYNCTTCFNNKKYCLGHEGRIPLNIPIQSEFTTNIHHWLKVTCFNCGLPVVKESDYIRHPLKVRLKVAAAAVKTSPIKTVKCPNCGTEHPHVTKDKERTNQFLAKYENVDKPRKLFAHNIGEYFNKIPDYVVLKLGKKLSSHPRKLILKEITVPTVHTRVDLSKNLGIKSPGGDYTVLLQNIIKENDNLPINIPDEIDEKLEKIINDLTDLYFIFTKGSQNKKIIGKGGANMSLISSMKGKTGFIRKNVLGKRTSKVMRTTIVGVQTNKNNEVTIPLRFAKTIQIEETVQEYNRKKLMINYLNGRDKYPGCTKVIKKSTGAEYSIDKIQQNYELEIGDKIFRDLETGDIFLYCRQPSLLPSNITCMKAKVTLDPDTLTFGMNVNACPLFNADFDGDAMNGYAIDKIGARAEASVLSSMDNWFIKHSHGAPMIGQVDDAIVGTFKLTKHDVVMDKYHAVLCFTNTTYRPRFTQQKYSGRDLVSFLLEQTPVNFTRPTNYYNERYAPYIEYHPDDVKVKIEHGKHISGVLDKKSITKGAVGGLYHIVATEYGAEAAINLIFNMQQVTLGFLQFTGHTISILDMMNTKESLEEIQKIETGIMNKSKLITEQLDRGEIIPPVGLTVNQHYEKLQINELRIMDDFSDPVLKSSDVNINGLLQLVVSGSKGSISHILHIKAAIGQIIIGDKRPKLKLSFGRSLPHFPRFDMSPSANGFINNCYIAGMTSYEMASNSKNARSDFISKALSTSVTGYAERKSIKNLEPNIINNFRMCVENENIIQYLYGDDGLDTRKIIKVKIPTVMISDEDLQQWNFKPKNSSLENVFKEEFNQIVSDRDFYRQKYMTAEIGLIGEPMKDEKMLSMDINRMAADIIYNFGEQKSSEEEIAEMVQTVSDFCSSLHYSLVNKIQKNKKTPMPLHIKQGTRMLEISIRAELNSNRYLKKINKKMLDLLLEKIENRQLSSLIDYGVAIGIIAAKSFSEPLTQYMLDAHHRTTTGGTSKSVMTDVSEVLGAKPTKDLSSPSMIITVKPEYESKEKMQELANYIESMKFLLFISSVQIFFENFGKPVHSQYTHEKEIIDNFVKNNPMLPPPGNLTKWCIRFVVDKTQLIFKNMPLETIIKKLRDKFSGMYFVYTVENSPEVIIRAYITNTYFADKKRTRSVNLEDLKQTLDELQETIIRGVDGIRSAEVTNVIRHEKQSDGSIKKNSEKLVIKTIGTNIKEILKMPEIVPEQLITDAIEETQKIFGIEAARQRLLNRIKGLGAGGLDPHHVSVYADVMTYTGMVTSIEKSGLNARSENNIMLRMGYSAPYQALEDAAINSITDPVRGITGSLMKGDTPHIGTYFNDFYVNSAMIAENTKKPDEWFD